MARSTTAEAVTRKPGLNCVDAEALTEKRQSGGVTQSVARRHLFGGVSGYTTALFITGRAFAYKLVIVVDILVHCLTPRPGS
jgi:hypothetical protein